MTTSPSTTEQTISAAEANRSAVAANCDALLSEDFQPGFTWRGVTVRNLFQGVG